MNFARDAVLQVGNLRNSMPWARALICVGCRMWNPWMGGWQFEGNRKRRGRWRAILGPGGPTPSSPSDWRWFPRQWNTSTAKIFVRTLHRPPPPSSPISSFSLSLSHSFPLFLVRTSRAPRAHTTRLIRARVCVSQRVRVISRLERLQVREEAANV